jgi:hypothetical protein
MIASIRSRGAALSALTAVLVAGALAGCTGGTEPTKSPTPKASKSAAAQADPGLTDITTAPGTREGVEGAKADNDLTTCEPKGDGWALAGTVTNSKDTAVDYSIYVSLLDKQNETRALVEIDVPGVAPAAKQDWSKDVALDEKNLTCVVRTERYPVATKK